MKRTSFLLRTHCFNVPILAKVGSRSTKTKRPTEAGAFSKSKLGYTHSVMSNPIITREEIIQSLEEAVTPVDFDALIKDGILEKDGAWFKVLDFKRLPKHASIKITTAKQG